MAHYNQLRVNLDAPYNEVLAHDVIKYGQNGEYFDVHGRNVKAPASAFEDSEDEDFEDESADEEVSESSVDEDNPPSPSDEVQDENLAAEAVEEFAT